MRALRIALLVLVASTVADAADPVRISANKTAGFAPLTVRIRVLVEPNADNRSLCIQVSGPLQESSSCFPHTPSHPSERNVTFTLPEGDYSFVAELQRADGSQPRSSVLVVSVL